MKIYLVFFTLVIFLLASIVPAFSVMVMLSNEPQERGSSASFIDDLSAGFSTWYNSETDQALRQKIMDLSRILDRLRAYEEIERFRLVQFRTGLAVVSVIVMLFAISCGIVFWLLTYRLILKPVRVLSLGLARPLSASPFLELEPKGIRDIRILYATVNELIERVVIYREQAMQAERENMSRFIVHEVRNALTPISIGVRALSGSLREEANDNSALRDGNQHLKLIQDSLNSLEILLEHLRSLYNARQPSLQIVDLEYIVKNLPSSGDPRVLFLSSSNNGTYLVRADPSSLGLALDNLVRNAIEAVEGSGFISEPGRVEILIKNEADETIELSIRDNGCGIKPEAVGQIWNEYFTTKQKGMGLGLAFTRKILSTQGINVELDSEVGRGTQFRLRFRAADPDDRRDH